MNKTLKVKLLTETAKVPNAAHPGDDLGYDLYSDEKIIIGPHNQAIISIGVALSFPPGYGGIIKDRSSVASMMLYTSAGVIDNGYQGEIKVLMRNQNHVGVVIEKGQKIAQVVVVEVHTVKDLEVVTEFTPTERGVSGFGSTGNS